MKSKLLLFAFIISAITAVAYWNFTRSAAGDDAWVKKASHLANLIDKATAQQFFKKHVIVPIHVTDFPKFSRDTLFVKFDQNSPYPTYIDGVLFIDGTYTSDTMRAISLLYGIARHNIQSYPVDYGAELATMESAIDETRGEQYIADVVTKLGGMAYRKMINEEKVRLSSLRYFEKTSQDAFKEYCKSFDAAFGKSISNEDTRLRMYYLHVAAAFELCDQAYGDNADGWVCKNSSKNEIQLAVRERALP